MFYNLYLVGCEGLSLQCAVHTFGDAAWEAVDAPRGHHVLQGGKQCGTGL